MPTSTQVPAALVHVRTFPLTTGHIEAIGACCNRKPFMRNLVHFSLGKMVSPKTDDWSNRSYVCAIIVPFSSDLQRQVHSFHPEDTTFLGDFEIPKASIVLYTNTISAEAMAEHVTYIQVPEINAECIENILRDFPTMELSERKFTEMYMQDFFTPYQRPNGVNPNCGLGLTMTSSFHEAMIEINILLLNNCTPKIMLPLVHGLMRSYLSEYPRAKAQLVARLAQHSDMQREEIDGREDFFQQVESFDACIRNRLTLQNMMFFGMDVAESSARFLLYFLNSDALSLREVTNKIQLEPSFLKTLQYSNICFQIFRLCLRLTLRTHFNLGDGEKDSLIAAHLTGPRPWASLNKNELEVQLSTAGNLLSHFQFEQLSNDLFHFSMRSLFVAVDQFMHDNQKITRCPVSEDELQTHLPGCKFTEFRRFLAAKGVAGEPFKAIAIMNNKVAQLYTGHTYPGTMFGNSEHAVAPKATQVEKTASKSPT